MKLLIVELSAANFLSVCLTNKRYANAVLIYSQSLSVLQDLMTSQRLLWSGSSQMTELFTSSFFV
jgi:hypothetical protein